MEKTWPNNWYCRAARYRTRVKFITHGYFLANSSIESITTIVQPFQFFEENEHKQKVSKHIYFILN